MPLEGGVINHAIRLQYSTTNNETEYEALLVGLKIAKTVGTTSLLVQSDSKLIIGQVNREYEAKDEQMQRYLQLVHCLMKSFEEVSLTCILCEQNAIVDQLARMVLSDNPIEDDKIVKSSSIEGIEINPVITNNTWMTPIMLFLKDGNDPKKAGKLRVQASRFTLMQRVLCKMAFSLPYLRCLAKDEADYVLREVHEGICGKHSRPRSLSQKLVHVRYYWSSMQRDAIDFVRKCDKYQRFGNLTHSSPKELTSMMEPWPFNEWGLDIMRPLLIRQKHMKFLVAINYFTKWVEAEPLARIIERNIQNLVWKIVVCRFEIPRVFVSDNGKQFDNSTFKEFWYESTTIILPPSIHKRTSK